MARRSDHLDLPPELEHPVELDLSPGLATLVKLLAATIVLNGGDPVAALLRELRKLTRRAGRAERTKSLDTEVRRRAKENGISIEKAREALAEERKMHSAEAVAQMIKRARRNPALQIRYQKGLSPQLARALDDAEHAGGTKESVPHGQRSRSVEMGSIGENDAGTTDDSRNRRDPPGEGSVSPQAPLERRGTAVPPARATRAVRRPRRAGVDRPAEENVDVRPGTRRSRVKEPP